MSEADPGSPVLAAIEHAHRATHQQARDQARLIAVTARGVAAIHGARGGGDDSVAALRELLHETLEALASTSVRR